MNIALCRSLFRINLADPSPDGRIPARLTRRGGRVVDGSGLENRQGESPRGFESHPLRHSILDFGLWISDCRQNPPRNEARYDEPDESGAYDIGEVMRGDIHS